MSRLIWPPRPLDSEVAKQLEADAYFVEVADATQQPQAEQGAGFLSTWLGVVKGTLAERASAAGFEVDLPDMYCTRCGRTTPLGRHGCAPCLKERCPWDRLIRLGPYEGLLGEVVREIKYTRWTRLGMELGTWMGASLASQLRAQGVQSGVLVPIPMHWLRRWTRGLDHARVLAAAASKASGQPLTEALESGYRWSQAGMRKSARRRNVKGTIRPKGRGGWAGEGAVVVVDDVKTTGATLGEAVGAVRSMGWRGPVWVLVAAVASGRIP